MVVHSCRNSHYKKKKKQQQQQQDRKVTDEDNEHDRVEHQGMGIRQLAPSMFKETTTSAQRFATVGPPSSPRNRPEDCELIGEKGDIEKYIAELRDQMVFMPDNDFCS